MSINVSKMQPWQVFHIARKYLGADVVAKVFNKEKRSAYSWAQNPDYTSHRCRSPLELLHSLFVRMDDQGLGYAVRAAINYLQTALDGGELGGEVVEPLATMGEEQLADYKCLAEFQAAIDHGAPAAEVKRLKGLACAEIDRTLAKYIKDMTHE